MKQSLQKDTLAFQFGVRPGVLHRDMGSVSLPTVVSALNVYMNDNPYGPIINESAKGHPERDGAVFYLLNHAVSLVRQRTHPYERLGKYLPIVEAYHSQLAVRSARMFFYLLLICTRESRHDKSSYTGSAWTEIRQKYGKRVVDFHQSIKGCGSSEAAQALRSHPADVPVGAYTKFLVDVFYKGYYSGGYGGAAWGAVADVLNGYVNGVMTAEMMMDTAFTLCHNNGPIFNKGMLYDSYSDEIYKLLDVQRSGQVPQLIGNKETHWGNDKSVRDLWTLCNDALDGAFGGYVDWFLVEELGSKKSYGSQKNAQVSAHGYPSKFKAKLEAEKMKKELEAKEAAKEAASMVEIMPHLKVKKVEVRP